MASAVPLHVNLAKRSEQSLHLSSPFAITEAEASQRASARWSEGVACPAACEPWVGCEHSTLQLLWQGSTMQCPCAVHGHCECLKQRTPQTGVPQLSSNAACVQQMA